jgi:hypothetical protein
VPAVGGQQAQPGADIRVVPIDVQTSRAPGVADGRISWADKQFDVTVGNQHR